MIKLVALLLVLIIVASLVPTLLTVEAESKRVIVELVFSRHITDDDIAKISKLGGKIVYTQQHIHQ
ncbi:MAG: hypothetical protein B6U85_05560 [Desulfurococcales archaeon ex4484_42]|nr:MAG: hypothetical protein B6U85_05560 [Desulfurococcales archaeon ex4484_42]